MWAVIGPVGGGKSTELMAAARYLQETAYPLLLPLDFYADVRQLGGDHLVGMVAACVFSLATRNLGVEFPPWVRQTLGGRGYLDENDQPGIPSPLTIRSQTPAVSLSDLLRTELRELASQRLVVLLVDGLEKAALEIGREAVETLITFRDEVAMALVLPYALATGPEAHGPLVVHGLELFAVPAVPVDQRFGEEAREGREFLEWIAANRGGPFDPASPEEKKFRWLVAEAAELSGGVPRTFLQLLEDAFFYSSLRDVSSPERQDLEAAASARRQAMARLLGQGDRDVLRAVDGTDGVELDLERRVRLLAHGILLEYRVGGSDVVLMHPLLGLQGSAAGAA